MEVFFEDAFPDPKTVFRSVDDATLMDFIDPEKMFLIHRRELLTYDLLVQPDIREIVRIVGFGRAVRPFVNLSRSEAFFRMKEIRRNFDEALPVIEEHLDDPRIQDIARGIFWGTPTLLIANKKRNLHYLEPFYLPSRKSLYAQASRTFEKMKY